MLPNDIGWLRGCLKEKWSSVKFMFSFYLAACFLFSSELTSSFEIILSDESNESRNGLCEGLQVLVFELRNLLVDSLKFVKVALSNHCASLLQKFYQFRVIERKRDVRYFGWWWGILLWEQN